MFFVFAFFTLEKKELFALFLALVVFLVGFLHGKNAQTYPAWHLVNYLSEQPQDIFVIGKVVSEPEISQTFYHCKKAAFILRPTDLKIDGRWQRAAGLIRVSLLGERAVGFGDELLLQGTISKPRGLRNPGGFNYRAYLASYRIFAILQVKEKDIVQTISANKAHLFTKDIFRLKQRLYKVIFKHLNPELGSLLAAILIGERSQLTQEVKDLFVNTGTAHILAISGLHVGLIAFILLALLKFLRLGRQLTFILTIFLLIGYAFLSGLRPSVIRATIMAITVLFGYLINREIKIYNSLALAALIILIFHPEYLFDSGFQLSFLSVISIVYFTPKIESAFSVHNRYLQFLIKAFSVSLAAWFGITPFLAHYFSLVSPVAIVANLVIIPWLFLVVSTGICLFIFASICEPLGNIFAQSAELTLIGLTKLAAFFAKIPLGFAHTPRPSILFFGVYYALLLLLFNYKRLRISLGKVGIILLLVANILVWRPLFKAPSDKLSVTFFDVGRGDAIFIEFPFSKGTMLIDAGPAQEETDAAREVILPFLWNKGISGIEIVMLTHPDTDHVGGMASVLKNMKVNYLFDNGMPGDSKGYRSYKEQAKKVRHYQQLKRGDKISGVEAIELFVLNPPQPFLSEAGADTNNASLVLKLVYKEVSFLFCADIQQQGIEQVLAYGADLNSTVLKVPHHGSDEGYIEEVFFQQAKPKLAIISVDSNNRFGLPQPELVQKLKQAKAQVYKTSENGAVIISTDGKDVLVETWQQD